MSLSVKKREELRQYILEQICRNEVNFSKKVQETFQVSRATVQKYLKRLAEEGFLRKDETGWRLVYREHTEVLTQKKLQMDEEAVFNYFLADVQGFPKRAFNSFVHNFLELLNNALEHASAKKITVTVRVSPVDIVCLIQDDGIGIFRRIQKHFSEVLNSEITLQAALAQLFPGGFTSSPENHGGQGIYNSAILADSLRIWSDGLLFTRDPEQLTGICQEDDHSPPKGTKVVFRTHRNTQRTLEGAPHANPDDGFFRVIVPLKKISLTGSTLIARSAARRLTVNFEGKTEVILDFAGIDELMQPFAHELFTVWHRQHPAVKITCVNTNEQIDRQIKRHKDQE